MSYRPNPTMQQWPEVRERLRETIAKWQRVQNVHADFSIETEASARAYFRDEPNKAVRAVTVRWLLDGVERVVTVDRWPKPVDNLWAIAVGLEDIRLNALRGLDDVARQVYGLLAASGETTTDPYAALGVRRGASRAEVERAYRDLAKSAHPNAGGSDAAMRRLNTARDEILGGGA